MAFNSLYEILIYCVDEEFLVYSFNSLYEILLTCLKLMRKNLYILSILFMRFIWALQFWIPIPNQLSILFMRFKFWQKNWTKNSCFFQFSLWDSNTWYNLISCIPLLSILFMRFIPVVQLDCLKPLNLLSILFMRFNPGFLIYQKFVKNLSILFMRFSDYLKALGELLYYLSILFMRFLVKIVQHIIILQTFNSLYEILLNSKSLYLFQQVSFNSLYEILSIYISKYWPVYSLSILFMRFTTGINY